MDRRARDAPERHGREERAHQDPPEPHGRAAARTVNPQDPAVIRNLDYRLEVRALHRQPHLFRLRAETERRIDLPSDRNRLLSRVQGDDEFVAVFTDWDRLAIVRERGDFRRRRELDEEVFTETA